ncbi:hypothetical protein KQI65_16040 [bacterium]|nr:hypothetical protein [bacterium]
MISGNDSTFGSIDGVRWIKPGNEYIVFLQFRSPHGYGANYFNNRYLTPGSIVGVTTTGGMYPIVNGYVDNPHNDFGLGEHAPVEEFVKKLRGAIDRLVETQ